MSRRYGPEIVFRYFSATPRLSLDNKYLSLHGWPRLPLLSAADIHELRLRQLFSQQITAPVT